MLAAAAELGIGTVIVPLVDPESIADRAGVEALARSINEAAALCGGPRRPDRVPQPRLRVRQAVDGQPAYELLVALLDPAVVLEVDVYWAGVGGADVFELLPRLGDRVRFLHVKNEPPDEDDPPLLGVDIAGRMDEMLALSRDSVELPVVEIVVHDGDVFPLVERNAALLPRAGGRVSARRARRGSAHRRRQHLRRIPAQPHRLPRPRRRRDRRPRSRPGACAGRGSTASGFAGSPAELLARDDVELVVNLTIPAAHAEVALAAIAAGKHVWGEKPLALDRATARAVLDAAGRRGRRRRRTHPTPSSAPASRLATGCWPRARSASRGPY